jgi:hypothetical protein
MPTRATSLQNSTLTGLTREVGSKYDEIKLVADNIDAIEAVADAMAAGVDFEDIAAVTVNVAQLQAEMVTKASTAEVDALELVVAGKVDKVAGSSLMTDAEHTKLAAMDVNATANQTDAYLLDRGNHTGTQSADTLTDGIVKVAMTATERAKLTAIEAGANNYVHPSKHPVTILDGGTNYGKVLKTDGAGVVGFGDVSWAEIGGKPTAFVPSAHEHSMDEITLGTLPAARVVVSEGRQFITAEQAALLLDMEVKSNKGVANGYAPLDSNGKINPSFLNDLNLIEVFTPADLNSMLNLTSAQPGDIAYRLDTNNTYMLAALPVNTEANWKQLNAGLSVVSVNGLSGVVNLNTANIPEGGSNYYFTNERVDDRVAALLQAGTNVSLTYDDISGTLTISANDTSVNWSEIQSKPTTVGGYGITDVYTKTETQTALPKIGFDTTNVTPPSTGQMAWNQDEKTVDVGINGVVLQMGQELMTMVRNGSGSTITQGTVCMGIGTVGASGRIVVSKADMSSPANAVRVIGVATENIANGADGFVTYFGKVRTVDTSAWNEGDILYVSNAVPGGLTNVVPTSGVKQTIARVINKHATTGTLMVRVLPINELAYYPNDSKIDGLIRADRWLASQNIAAMVYTGSDLTKIQYNAATNVDYEVLAYTNGDLTSIQHYIGSVLKGTTTLTYSSGTLVSAVFTGV